MFVLQVLFWIDLNTYCDFLINLWVENNLWHIVILYLHERIVPFWKLYVSIILKSLLFMRQEVLYFFFFFKKFFTDLCYGFNHLFSFKIKINFIMPRTRIRFYLVILLNSTLGQWDLALVYKKRWTREHFLEVLYCLIQKSFNTKASCEIYAKGEGDCGSSEIEELEWTH